MHAWINSSDILYFDFIMKLKMYSVCTESQYNVLPISGVATLITLIFKPLEIVVTMT